MRSILLIILVAGLNGRISLCQVRESLVKAGYIEKFTHFFQWPETRAGDNPQDVFNIAVIGENTFGEDLADIFNKTSVKDKPVMITTISSVEQIKDCNILFISASEKNNLDEILNYTNGKPILTISDTKGFGKNGVIINMFREGDYIRYEINRTSLEKSGLIINSMLLNYAVII
jgi:hypothetical protein